MVRGKVGTMSHYCLRLLFDEVRLPDFTYLSLFLCISIYQLSTDTHTHVHTEDF